MDKLTGQVIVEKWIGFVRRYLFVSEAQALVLALWAIHSWVYEKFGACPYLEVYAPNKGMGKTRVLEVLELLVRGPERMATARIAPIVRLIEEHQSACTLLIDEAEKLAAGTFGETRSALAAGYRRGASHPVVTAQGVKRFPTYCPKAFALIGNIMPVLRDRSLPILLGRGKPEADLLAEYAQAVEASDALKGAMLTFARESGALRHPPVEIPEWLHGRDAEIWAPLFSVAHAMGLHKDTLSMLTAASVDFSELKEREPLPSRPTIAANEADAELAHAERLLADVANVIREGDKTITTEDLLARLRAIATAPWRSYRSVGLDAVTLAGLLNRYGVGPENIQVGKGKDRRIVKGYKVAAIAAAVKRAGE